MICPHCKRETEDKKAAAHENWTESEEENLRMDIIVRNGPSGDHYQVVHPWEDDFEQAEDL